jgi:hypothetical protein
MAKKSAEAWDIEFQGIVSTMIDDAKSFVEGDIRTRRTMATDYWKGRLPDVDGEEAEADSSTVVMTEVRDTVLAMMPNLMRMFFGGQSVETYMPLRAEAEEKAKQATEFANEVVLQQDNPGFSIFWDWFLDALVRCNGFVKTWHETIKTPVYSELTGLDEIALAAEVGDADTKILGKRAYTAKDAEDNDILDGATGEPITLYDVKIRKYVERKRIRVDAIPCEEVLVNSTANTYDMQRFKGFIGHRTLKTVSELVEMGYDQDEVENASTDTSAVDNEETQARRSDAGGDMFVENSPGDPSQKRVVFTEGVAWIDYDQDGIAEMRQMCCVGTDNKILKNEPIDYQPISTLCPYPEPFTFFGMSVADQTMDIQRINSRIGRDMLNSLAQAVEPMMGAVDGQVNLDDLLNPDISKVVRMRQPGMVNPIITPFVGREALPVIEYMKGIREARTGISDASQGLDPKVLQSTDNDAVMATLTNGQARLELVARIFAETGVKHLFKNILHLMTKYPDKERMVRLRGKWVQVDTSQFDANMDVEVDMPLGRGTVRDQIGFLMTVNANQGELLQQLGPENPIVTIDQFVNTKRRITELGGFKNVDAFWLNPDAMQPEEKQAKLQAAMQNMQAQSQGDQQGPAAPDPQVEKMKVDAMLQKEAMIDKREREFKMAELNADMQKNAADNEAKIIIAQINAQTSVQSDAIKADITKYKTEMDNKTKIIVESIKPRGGADNGSKPNGAAH